VVICTNSNQIIRKADIMLRRKYALIALVAGLLALPTRAQSQAPQATPAPANAQPPSAQAEVQLVVECAVGDNHECVTDSTETLGHHIKLRVPTLKSWIDKKNSPSNLVLFLNGRQLAKTNPVSVSVSYDPAHPELNELIFKLQRTAETDATWDDLIVRDKNWRGFFLKGVSRRVRPSIGLENGVAAETHAVFELELLPLGWVYVCFGFMCFTLVGLIILARKSALLRDNPGGPYSLARTQMAIWSWLLVNAYFFLFVMTRDPAVDIPTSILGLLGISSTTYLAAALVDRSDGTSTPPTSKGFWKDISGSSGVQLHRIQIIAWTVVLAFVFILRIFAKLSIPDFNPTLLGLLGLSAGTYVGFKFPENQKPASTPATPPAAKTAAAGG
jgi:uncharacterized RDD family membrane protein YckC